MSHHRIAPVPRTASRPGAPTTALSDAPAAADPRPRRGRPRRPRVRAALIALVLVLALLVFAGAVRAAVSPRGFSLPSLSSITRLLPGGELDEDDGILPEDRDVTVLDERTPAVTRLDPSLRSALRDAAADAAEDHITLRVTSGWRSERYQQRLLDRAAEERGSREEAARWVATPETSEHVSGEAVDIGGTDADQWLSEHGADYGLCQIYANEAWHYELRPQAADQGCPPMFADPTEDPRMSA